MTRSVPNHGDSDDSHDWGRLHHSDHAAASITDDLTCPPAIGEAIRQWSIVRWNDGKVQSRPDEIPVEEPLEIRVRWTVRNRDVERPIAMTMRTPGNDSDLAIGFLVTEGILRDPDDVAAVTCHHQSVTVRLRPGTVTDVCDRRGRTFVTSACGMCGKTTIDDIDIRCDPIDAPEGIVAGGRLLLGMLDRLRESQTIFERTGAVHGCGLFSLDGRPMAVAEDVGRHNALDKLIGSVWRHERSMFRQGVLALSGRVSFELIQKSLVVGIPVVVAVGAPSSMAVELADRHGQTVVGFATGGRYNVYSHAQRLRDP